MGQSTTVLSTVEGGCSFGTQLRWLRTTHRMVKSGGMLRVISCLGWSRMVPKTHRMPSNRHTVFHCPSEIGAFLSELASLNEWSMLALFAVIQRTMHFFLSFFLSCCQVIGPVLIFAFAVLPFVKVLVFVWRRPTLGHCASGHLASLHRSIGQLPCGSDVCHCSRHASRHLPGS